MQEKYLPSEIERAAQAQTMIGTRFDSKQRTFLDFVLAHYVSVGVEEQKEVVAQKLHLLDGLLLGHRLVDERHQTQEFDTLFLGIFSTYLFSKMLLVKPLKTNDVLVWNDHKFNRMSRADF